MADSKLFDRLAKLCGMLGSPHEGERAVAALKATEALQAAGMTWAGLIEAARGFAGSAKSRTIEEAFRQARQEKAPKEGEHIEDCEVLLRHHHKDLSDWEQGFLRNLTTKFRFSKLTPKQAHHLEIIVSRFYPSNEEKRRA